MAVARRSYFDTHPMLSLLLTCIWLQYWFPNFLCTPSFHNVCFVMTMEKEEKKALKKKKLLHCLFQVLNESRKKKKEARIFKALYLLSAHCTLLLICSCFLAIIPSGLSYRLCSCKTKRVHENCRSEKRTLDTLTYWFVLIRTDRIVMI